MSILDNHSQFNRLIVETGYRVNDSSVSDYLTESEVITRLQSKLADRISDNFTEIDKYFNTEKRFVKVTKKRILEAIEGYTKNDLIKLIDTRNNIQLVKDILFV